MSAKPTSFARCNWYLSARHLASHYLKKAVLRTNGIFLKYQKGLCLKTWDTPIYGGFGRKKIENLLYHFRPDILRLQTLRVTSPFETNLFKGIARMSSVSSGSTKQFCHLRRGHAPEQFSSVKMQSTRKQKDIKAAMGSLHHAMESASM